jgi:hypothetical protein
LRHREYVLLQIKNRVRGEAMSFVNAASPLSRPPVGTLNQLSRSRNAGFTRAPHH